MYWAVSIDFYIKKKLYWLFISSWWNIALKKKNCFVNRIVNHEFVATVLEINATNHTYDLWNGVFALEHIWLSSRSVHFARWFHMVPKMWCFSNIQTNRLRVHENKVRSRVWWKCNETCVKISLKISIILLAMISHWKTISDVENFGK